MTESPRLRFFVEGPPVPLARHRIARLPTGKLRTYTPAECAAYEEKIAFIARGAVARTAEWRRDARFLVDLIAYDNRRNYDLDNLVKAALDGITKAGNVWVDDRRVDSIQASRVRADTRAEASLSGGGLAIEVVRLDV